MVCHLEEKKKTTKLEVSKMNSTGWVYHCGSSSFLFSLEINTLRRSTMMTQKRFIACQGCSVDNKNGSH